MPEYIYIIRVECDNVNLCYGILEVLERSCSMENRFTAVFERTDKWWIAYVEELPGANTQGATLEEARENLKGAVVLVLEANRELAERRLSGKEVVREDLVVVSA